MDGCACPCLQWTCPATATYAVTAAVRACDNGINLQGTAATVAFTFITMTAPVELGRIELKGVDPLGAYRVVPLSPNLLIPGGSLIQIKLQPQGPYSAAAVRLTIKRVP